MSFKKQAVLGIKWNSFSQFGKQGIQLLTSIVLARLLQPSDFGLVAMAAVLTGFIAIFSDLGTSAAVIQRKNLSENLLSSIFWVNVAFGVLTMAILFTISPLVSLFYGEPRVSAILKALSLTFFISGFSALHQTMLVRDLTFDKLAKIEITAALLGSISGICSAMLGSGVWSLVVQSLVSVMTTTALLWLTSSWKPGFMFHWHEIKTVSNYSLNLTGFNIFNYFARNADNLLVGRYLGAQALGYYNLAYVIMMYPLQNVSHIIGRVMFPFYSQIQNDNASFRSIYLKMAAAIATVTFPMMLGLMVVAKPLILTVFGVQWSPMILVLLILSPVGMAQSILHTLGNIYQAKARTDILFRWGVFSGILVVISFMIGLRWGIVGVASAYALTVALLAYPNFAIPFRLIGLRVRELWMVLLRPLASSLVMFAVLVGLKSILSPSLSNVLILVILIPTGIVLYLLTSWNINREHMLELVRYVKE